MTLTESSKVRFVVEGRSVVGKRPVIGFTAEYTISNLLELMEKSEQEAKDIRDACKDMYFSPIWQLNIRLILDLDLKVDCRSVQQDVTLQVKVRELPTESTAKETAARAIKQAAEIFKQESLRELERMEGGIAFFSNVLMGTEVSHISVLSFNSLTFPSVKGSLHDRRCVWCVDYCQIGVFHYRCVSVK